MMKNKRAGSLSGSANFMQIKRKTDGYPIPRNVPQRDEEGFLTSLSYRARKSYSPSSSSEVASSYYASPENYSPTILNKPVTSIELTNQPATNSNVIIIYKYLLVMTKTVNAPSYLE
ncbi:hypothetical protein CEXT_141241 [Caerostris extrusa]|uniref:Uncharacterized protein n=1 Tax=Caerostris extrusa TaxID=172846 RepID=A0AAV4W8A2_CAEEX|nr:hypothetical protein CEXT_141241 [Caerostris extrusa]